MTHLFFETALLPEGWIENVCVEVDDTGWISAVKSGSDGAGVDFRGVIGRARYAELPQSLFPGSDGRIDRVSWFRTGQLFELAPSDVRFDRAV